MTFQQSGVTLAQLLATPIVPITQTPSAPVPNALVAIQTAPVTITIATPSWKTRASRKHPKGAGQSFTAPSFETRPLTPPPLDLGDSQVDATRAPTYVHTFTIDGVPLPATDRVRP